MLGKKKKKTNSEKEERKTDKTPRVFKDNLLIRLQREVFGASLKREAPDLKCLQVLLGWSGSATGEHLQRIIFGHYL